MRTLRPTALASVALAAFLAGAAAGPVAAEKPGVARISDSANPAPPVTTAGYTNTWYDNGGAGPSNCPAGNGNGGVCEGRGYPEAYRDHCWLRPGVYHQRLRWDYVRGPAIHAAVRIPVGYQQWLPEHPYGDPRYGVPENATVAPMVYLPTDTTQLGYYYQHVPTWVPKPRMIPPYPYPSNFHRIDRPPTATGPCPVSGRRSLCHGLFHRGGSCDNPQCGCRNCKCGANCGCRMETWSVPNSPSQPTPTDSGPEKKSNPDVPPPPKTGV